MRFRRILFLIAAGYAGSLVYKAMHHPETPVEGGSRSFYESVTGAGSLTETLRNARANPIAIESNYAKSAGGIGSVGSPYDHLPGRNGTPTLFNRIASGTKHSKPTEDFSLLEAASKGDAATVESRLEQRAPIDSRDNERRTALMYAAWNGHNDVIERLIAAGANMSLEDHAGNTAYDYAAGRGLSDTVQFMLSHAHASDDRHYLDYAGVIQAAYAGDASRLPAGKINPINRVNPEGQTPMHIAAGNGSLDFMQALVQRGAKIDTANAEGRTPMHWAAWNNRPRAIEFLAAHGADLSVADAAGDTPLLLATQNDSKEAVQMLVSKGVDKYAADKQGKTAAIIAEDKGYKDLLPLLQ
jgi:ankyrin repeat protein